MDIVCVLDNRLSKGFRVLRLDVVRILDDGLSKGFRVLDLAYFMTALIKELGQRRLCKAHSPFSSWSFQVGSYRVGTLT